MVDMPDCPSFSLPAACAQATCARERAARLHVRGASGTSAPSQLLLLLSNLLRDGRTSGRVALEDGPPLRFPPLGRLQLAEDALPPVHSVRHRGLLLRARWGGGHAGMTWCAAREGSGRKDAVAACRRRVVQRPACFNPDTNLPPNLVPNWAAHPAAHPAAHVRHVPRESALAFADLCLASLTWLGRMCEPFECQHRARLPPATNAAAR